MVRFRGGRAKPANATWAFTRKELTAALEPLGDDAPDVVFYVPRDDEWLWYLPTKRRGDLAVLHVHWSARSYDRTVGALTWEPRATIFVPSIPVAVRNETEGRL